MANSKSLSEMPVFVPKQRHAIIMNNYDTFLPETDAFQRLSPQARGNRRAYEMQALLAGQNSYGDLPEWVFEYWFDSEINAHKKNRTNLKYSSVTTILPDSYPKTMRVRLEETLDGIATSSTDGNLTFTYITTHGEVGTFRIDNDHSMDYEELLDRMDKIKGKKALMVMACHSGSLVDILKDRKTRDDYIVLTSTAKDEQGVNWTEDKLHHIIAEHTGKALKIADLIVPNVISSGDIRDVQHPLLKRSYNVVL